MSIIVHVDVTNVNDERTVNPIITHARFAHIAKRAFLDFYFSIILHYRNHSSQAVLKNKKMKENSKIELSLIFISLCS